MFRDKRLANGSPAKLTPSILFAKLCHHPTPLPQSIKLKSVTVTDVTPDNGPLGIKGG